MAVLGSLYNVWEYPQAWIKPYKHVALYSAYSGEDRKEPASYDGKMSESLSRTRRLFFDYAMCNEFDLFVTFTFDKERYNSMVYDDVAKPLREYFKNYRQRYDAGFRYMLIPEKHESGAWHFHGLTTTPLGLEVPDKIPKRLGNVVQMVPNTPGYMSWPAVRDKFGWFSCSAIKDYYKCVMYITKYITKALDNPDLKGRRLLLKSAGLKKPELVKSSYESVYLPDGFQSEFCSVAWRENQDNVPAGMVPTMQPEEYKPREFLYQDVIAEQMRFLG